MNELETQRQVADYIRLQYPHAIFHSDFGSGLKLTIGQAARQARLNGGRRAWPDMFIAEPNMTADTTIYAGLFIELKRQGTRLKKQNGDWASDHIAEQAEMLERLRFRGYAAEFAVGFDEAKEIIDEYLGDLV
ncbi:hypothetical protein IJ098_00375 [Candidatus Saccharibacteria bacterium]|nr:hypothetical protein [Candidatus Saccharibacteria bacterium]